MGTIYIIMQENGYDGFECPPDEYYTCEDKANEYCAILNNQHYGTNKKYHSFFVHELTPKKL